jgi:hypothetical protein
MDRLLMLTLSAVLATSLVQSARAEKIDGYDVVQDTGLSQEVTDLESGLGKLVDLGPLELGAAEQDHLVIHLWFRLTDAVPISGKVHKIKFQDLKLNEVQFTIPEIDAFTIPSSPPYEVEDPLTVKASYSDIELGMLQEMLAPNYTFLVTGKMLVFGKFKIDNKNKKYVIPVNINVELSSDSLAESEYRDAVADQIFEVLKADLLKNLDTWRVQIKEGDAGTATPSQKETPTEKPAPATKGSE